MDTPETPAVANQDVAELPAVDHEHPAELPDQDHDQDAPELRDQADSDQAEQIGPLPESKADRKRRLARARFQRYMQRHGPRRATRNAQAANPSIIDSEHGGNAGATRPQPDPRAPAVAGRAEAESEYRVIKALARKLDRLIAADGASDTRLRLRMDYARTLSILRDRINRLPQPKPGARVLSLD